MHVREPSWVCVNLNSDPSSLPTPLFVPPNPTVTRSRRYIVDHSPSPDPLPWESSGPDPVLDGYGTPTVTTRGGPGRVSSVTSKDVCDQEEPTGVLDEGPRRGESRTGEDTNGGGEGPPRTRRPTAHLKRSKTFVHHRHTVRPSSVRPRRGVGPTRFVAPCRTPRLPLWVWASLSVSLCLSVCLYVRRSDLHLSLLAGDNRSGWGHRRERGTGSDRPTLVIRGHGSGTRRGG